MTPIIATPLIKPIKSADAYLPECIRELTVGGRSALAWVNIQTSPEAKAGAIHIAFNQSEERRTLSQPGRPGFFVPTDRPNVIVVGMEQQIGLLDLALNQFEPLASIPEAHAKTIINDGEVIPGGSGVVFGTKDLKCKDPTAGLYLWTAVDNNITLLKDSQICSNGKIFHRDNTGLYLYDIDSPKKKVVKYKFDLLTKSLDRGKTVLNLHDREDMPDGMVGCGDLSAVIAFYNPDHGGDGEAARYNLETGKMITRWTLPGSPRVTCPLIVRRLDSVNIVFTTADEGMSDVIRKDSPNAGAIFMASFGAENIRITAAKKKGVVRLQTDVVKLG